MSDIDITARKVAKRYRYGAAARPRSLRNLGEWGTGGDRWALRGVDLDVERGETLGMIGPNGSGKSTLLRLLAGLTRPTSGRITVRRPAAALLTLGEGFHPLLSGEENAVTGGMLGGFTRREAAARVGEIARFAGLEHWMDRPLRTYSDGMRLRLAFAVAISVDPEILLLDEVLAVGDLAFQQKCLARLQEMQANGVTIVLATHDLGQVRALCRRALWLRDGRVAGLDAADSVAAEYERAMYETAPPAEHPVRRDGSRVGSREVEIVGVRLLDASGRETGRILPGARACVEIDFVAHASVDGAIIGVSAHRRGDGERCFEITTDSNGGVGSALPTSGTVRLEMDRLDLGGGPYHLAVGIYEGSWAYPYDYVWEALSFEVAAPGGRGGFAPPHRWSVR